MRGWIYLLAPGCCLPLAVPDRLGSHQIPLCVVYALGSFPLPPCSSGCVRYTLRLCGLRATCHLTLRLPVRSLRQPHASIPRLSRPPLALVPGIRFLCSLFASAPCACLLPFLGPLCPCQFLVLSSVPLPSPARSALCLLFVCSSLCPPRFLSCPPSVRPLSTLPLHVFLPHSPRCLRYIPA